MLRHRAASALIVPAFLLIASVACATRPETGIMAASWTPPKDAGLPTQTVTIAWQSDSPTTGEMTFTLGKGGERFVGSYLLIQGTKVGSSAVDLYDLWAQSEYVGAHATAAWFQPGWGYDVWIRHYDGRVVVGLHGDRGDSARCHFTLADTETGMPGGGTGACQITDGGTLDVRF